MDTQAPKLKVESSKNWPIYRRILYAIIVVSSISVVYCSALLYGQQLQAAKDLVVGLLPWHKAPTLRSGQSAVGSADWKTYTNSQYGFSFEYPSAWKTDLCGSSAIFFNGGCDSDSESTGHVMVLANTSFVDYSKGYNFGTAENIKLANISAKSFSGTIENGDGPGNPNGTKTRQIYFEKDKNLFEIVLDEKPGENLQSDFNQILSTFKFTDSGSAVDTSTWKTYTNSQYGFSFEYPASVEINNSVKIPTPTSDGVTVGNFTVTVLKPAEYDAKKAEYNSYLTEKDSMGVVPCKSAKFTNPNFDTTGYICNTDDATQAVLLHSQNIDLLVFVVFSDGLSVMDTQQFISTFKFTDSSCQSNDFNNCNTKIDKTTVYQNPVLNFELTFPAGWYLPKLDDNDPHFYSCPAYDCDGLEVQKIKASQDYDKVFSEDVSEDLSPVKMDSLISGARVISSDAPGGAEGWGHEYDVFINGSYYVIFAGAENYTKIESILSTFKFTK